MGGSNGKLQDLTSRLVDRATACGMEVSTEKSKIRANFTDNISADIGMNGQKLEDVASFKYTKTNEIDLPPTGERKERKHWALRPQKPLRLTRDGEDGGSGILYLTTTVTTRMILH